MTPTKTTVAQGTHYDDCIFGLPGTLLKAARWGHRVVILTLQARFEDHRQLIEVSRGYGVEMLFLDFPAGICDTSAKNIRRRPKLCWRSGPTSLFTFGPMTPIPDHFAAAPICQAAL